MPVKKDGSVGIPAFAFNCQVTDLVQVFTEAIGMALWAIATTKSLAVVADRSNALVLKPGGHVVIPAAMLAEAMNETDDGPGIVGGPLYGVNVVAVGVGPREFFEGGLHVVKIPAFDRYLDFRG